MKHPDKWRETQDPYKLPFRNFILREIVGYPHAGNDVFQVRGIYRQREVEAYIKVARLAGADIANEIRTIRALNHPLAPQIIDCDGEMQRFVVTLAREGERLSVILGDNGNLASLNYLYEYGRTLAKLHSIQGDFGQVKDRRFFHIPEKGSLVREVPEFVHEYLISHCPQKINRCFCHGDFHYANLLWKDGHLSAILDFELSGMGNREFDIAWAFALRQGQRFLNTEEEVSRFMEGYLSAGECDRDYVRYYLVQIYCYFYQFNGNPPEYKAYMEEIFRRYCKQNKR